MDVTPTTAPSAVNVLLAVASLAAVAKASATAMVVAVAATAAATVITAVANSEKQSGSPYSKCTQHYEYIKAMWKHAQ